MEMYEVFFVDASRGSCVLSIFVVVLVVGTLLALSAHLGVKLLREYLYQRRTHCRRTRLPLPADKRGAEPADKRGAEKSLAPARYPPVFDRRVVTILPEGALVSATLPLARSLAAVPGLSPAWYRRLRIFISLSFLLMVLLTLFVQSGLAAGTLRNLSKDLSLLSYSQFSATDVHTAAHVAAVNASQQLIRISQLDPAQYNSSSDYSTWAYSACSAASMTEVFDSYGRNFRIGDVLKVEARIGAITPQLGLVDPSGIQATAAQFGFKTVWSNSWQLDQIIGIANSGKPVIVSFPPARYDGGHILVLLGGDASMVYLADTSLWNRHALSRGQFMNWWEGFGAVVTPA
jgi:hypothetical protein